jgi:hypothetical protein
MQDKELKSKKYYIKFCLQIILPILIGIMVYVFWRGISFVDPYQKVFPIFHYTKTPDWVKYNLPDGLWLYAFLSTLFIIWRQQISKHFVAWILLAIILSFFLEILQAWHIIPGTFDWYDLLAYALSVFIFVVTKIRFKEKFVFTLKF